MDVLIADDEEIIHKLFQPFLQRLGHGCFHAYDGVEACSQVADRAFDLAFVDVRMPKMDGLELLTRMQAESPETLVAMITGHGELDVAIAALRAGAWDFLNKPLKLDEIEAVLLRAEKISQLHDGQRRLKQAIGGIQSAQALREGTRRLVGDSRATRRIREQIAEAVQMQVDTILITGETGVGKEVVAREIHFQPESEESPFIAVNCPALADTLVEAELFGHARGAFTGATVDRPGYFERANGGTLLLDEVADLSSDAQAALLRALETRTVIRVGGAEERQLNLRVIAATNQALDSAVEDGRFRRDLLYRLNLYAIEVPPLRERREDVVPLAMHFIDLFAKPRALEVQGLTDEAAACLMAYDYPGNVRELRNIVERGCVKAKEGLIDVRHLGSLTDGYDAAEPHATSSEPADQKSRILAELERTKWNRRAAARNLGYTYAKLRYWMSRYGLQ